MALVSTGVRKRSSVAHYAYQVRHTKREKRDLYRASASLEPR